MLIDLNLMSLNSWSNAETFNDFHADIW